MKLKDVRESYYEFSGKTSDLVRTLALSAIAIVWVFRIESDDGPALAAPLLIAGLLAVSALAFDLLQYVVATIIWGGFHRQKEKAQLGEEAEFDAPGWINRPSLTFFALKIILVAAAYFVLVVHLARSL